MKKILCITILFIITGCSSKTIMVEKPISVIYNERNIVEKDYESITNIINELNFSCGKVKNVEGNKLLITTNNQVYQFHISSNYYMEFQENDKYCYTKEVEKVKKLIETLNQNIIKYTDISFFTIRSEENYEIEEADTIIKLDKKKNYIIINSKYPLTSFKINEIEYQENGNYIEIDLLYNNELIETNNNIVIRKEILQIPNFKISFYNQYNYLVNILPILNENNEINFITNIQKNS